MPQALAPGFPALVLKPAGLKRTSEGAQQLCDLLAVRLHWQHCWLLLVLLACLLDASDL